MNFEAFLSYFFIFNTILSTAIIFLGAIFHPSCIQIGTFLLLITPIGRVLLCHIHFVNHRYYQLGACTLFTLTLLLLSSLGFIKV